MSRAKAGEIKELGDKMLLTLTVGQIQKPPMPTQDLDICVETHLSFH